MLFFSLSFFFRQREDEIQKRQESHRFHFDAMWSKHIPIAIYHLSACHSTDRGKLYRINNIRLPAWRREKEQSCLSIKGRSWISE